MPESVLLVEKEGPLDWVTLNRPESLNALDTDLVTRLRDYFRSLASDTSVRVVVLRAMGRAFCAGYDIKEHGQMLAEGSEQVSAVARLQVQRRISEIALLMRRCPQPIIALVNGAACGGGFSLALAADIRIAAPAARMNAAAIRIGLSACDVGISYLLPRLIGGSIAAELLMTGRFIDAERALRVGLVSEVVPADKLAATGRLYAQEMLAASPAGLMLTKDCLNTNLDAGSLENALAVEDRNQVICAMAGDNTRAVHEFLARRPG
jgi:enoyl-CoA hydratase